jgi:flavodoxin
MQIIVIYKSKSGYTETYAKWISEDLNFDLKVAGDITIE